MERPHTASDNLSIKSGIPIMLKGKNATNVNSESSCRSAIPRLQTRMIQQFEHKKHNNLHFRSKSFDERTAHRGFEMITNGKGQLKRQISNTNFEDHIARAKRSGSATTRGSSLPRYALDAHRRSTSTSKSTPNATSASPSETCFPLTQLDLRTKTTMSITQRKKNVRTAQVVTQSIFIAKKKKFQQLKTELQEKQKQVMEAYSSILETKKLIEEKTGKSVEVEKLELLKSEKEIEREKPKIDNDFVQQMEQKLTQIPIAYQALCKSLLENRSDIIHWLSMQHACKNHVVSKQLDLYKKETDKYQQLVLECDTTQQTMVSELLENWKTLWTWKETCINERFSELETENHNVKDMVNDLTSELDKFRSAKVDLEKKLIDAENNLLIMRKKIEEKEKELENMNNKSKNIEKQTICNYEAKLKLRKQRQKDMESKIKALEQKIESLNAINRKMDEELKNRGNSFDSKTKELVKSSKLNEALVAKLEKERIGLDMRIKDLQQLLDSRELDYENDLKEYKSSIQTFESKIIAMQKEIDIYKKKYSDVRNELVQLQMKCHQDNEIMKKRKFATEPGGPGINTQTEMDMWAELQATRVALKVAEEKLQRNNEERDRFLQTIEKAVSEKDQLSSEGWTAKLVLKDEEIECLKHQVEQLSDAIVHSRDLATKQEKKISDLKKALDSLVANEATAAATSASTDASTSANVNKKEIDQNVLEMKAKWEKEHKKTHELENMLRECEAKMETMKTKIKDLEKMMKVRDGLIGVLRSKKDMTLIEHDELRNYVHELSNQYNEISAKYEAKSNQIDDLRTSIECKTMQIERLEKTVKSMEDLCQETNKTNLELKERIKFYQKQFEEYQLSIVRPTTDMKGTVGIFYKPTEGNSYMLASTPPV